MASRVCAPAVPISWPKRVTETARMASHMTQNLRHPG